MYARVAFSSTSRKFAESESSCHRRLNHRDARDAMKHATAVRKDVRDRVFDERGKRIVIFDRSKEKGNMEFDRAMTENR